MTEQPASETDTPRILAGKKGLIVGVANDKSIAWGIARRAAEAGAELGFTYQGEVLLKRVAPLAESVGSKVLVPMDVTDDAQVEEAFQQVKDQMGSIDFLVHSIAFADREDLRGRTLDTSREGFMKAMNISVYSLIQLAREAEPIMNRGGCILTLSYYGAVRAVPSYNVMGIAKAALESAVRYLARDLGESGIRMNAISAGPIKTLAASGVPGLRTLIGELGDRAPLQRNIDINDVGGAGVYLLSPLASGVTGEIHYVDAGLHTSAWVQFEAPGGVRANASLPPSLD